MFKHQKITDEIEAHKDCLLLADLNPTVANFFTLLNAGAQNNDNRVLAACIHAITYYVSQTRGSHQILHFQDAIDSDVGLVKARMPMNAMRLYRDSMKTDVAALVMHDFCKACRIHGHHIGTCPINAALTKAWAGDPIKKAIYGSQKGRLGRKRGKGYIDKQVGRKVLNATKRQKRGDAVVMATLVADQEAMKRYDADTDED